MLRCKWCLALGILAVGTFALAYDVELNNATPLDEGAALGGTLMGGAGVTPPEGDIVYHSPNISGYYFRPYPGYIDYDDIHLEPDGKYANGALIKYSMTVFGSTVSGGGDAGSPGDIMTMLWDDPDGDTGTPDMVPIAGTDCYWSGVPTGFWELECVVPAGIELPPVVWMSFETLQANWGWIIADFNDCPTTGPPGFSEDFFVEYDYWYGGFTYFFFGGCPANPNASFGNAKIVAEGQPWACCDYTTYTCVNVYETECLDMGGMFTEDVLCNNLPAPCSMAGACCDVPTGVCTDTFEIFCDGFKQTFFPGELCMTVVARGDCIVPPNVPTLTQWGMIALTVVLLTGLTIKFGRRRTVTA